VIVLSYRRGDSAGLTRALHERLVRERGPEAVFIDVDAIEGGADFRRRMAEVISRCEALLVVIGPAWLTAGGTGGPRLQEPEDVVRFEIATALRHGRRVFPVLVDGAAMPARSDLPEDVRAMSDRNALRVRHETFETDVTRLLDALAVRRGAPLAYGPLAAAVAAAAAYAVLAWRGRLYAAGLAAVAALVAAALLHAARPWLARSGSAARLLGAGVAAAAAGLVFLAGWTVRERLLSRPFTLTVRAQGRDGRPLPGGSVRLREQDRSAPIANGEAAFPGLPERLVGQGLGLTVTAEDYQPLSANVPVPASHVVAVTLEPRPYATKVRGHVIDARGRALAGVSVDIDEGRARTVSDGEGNFALTLPVRPGTRLKLRAALEGREGYDGWITVPERTPLDVRFVPR
jgi:hypothetical protein